MYLLISRIQIYKQFKDFGSRIMVATDIFGRGIDIERVNVVINYDMPENSDTYLHRVRFTLVTLLIFRLEELEDLEQRVLLSLLYRQLKMEKS